MSPLWRKFLFPEVEKVEVEGVDVWGREVGGAVEMRMRRGTEMGNDTVQLFFLAYMYIWEIVPPLSTTTESLLHYFSSKFLDCPESLSCPL